MLTSFLKHVLNLTYPLNSKLTSTTSFFLIHLFQGHRQLETVPACTGQRSKTPSAGHWSITVSTQMLYSHSHFHTIIGCGRTGAGNCAGNPGEHGYNPERKCWDQTLSWEAITLKTEPPYSIYLLILGPLSWIMTKVWHRTQNVFIRWHYKRRNALTLSCFCFFKLEDALLFLY